MELANSILHRINNAYLYDKSVYTIINGLEYECKILRITNIDCELKIVNTNKLFRRKFSNIKFTTHD